MVYDDYSLVRLFSPSALTIVEHILALTPRDKYLRFGHAVADTAVCKYVTRTISTTNTKECADFWFGITLNSTLVATLHISIQDNAAEFAFTVDEQHRGKKLGQLLFARAYQLVTEVGIDRIYLACLSENIAMRCIAKKFGLAVMTHGPDAEGSVTIQYPVSLKQLDLVKRVIIDKGILTNS